MGGLYTRGDVPIWGLWESHTETIIDVIPGDLYCYSHKKVANGITPGLEWEIKYVQTW